MNTEQQQYNLPNSEQLGCYYYLRRQLQDRPETASDEDKKAFCHLILGMCPDAMSIKDVDLVEKLCPEEWPRYCEWEWGTPDEQQALKDAELIAAGWARGPDSEMYIPFP